MKNITLQILKQGRKNALKTVSVLVVVMGFLFSTAPADATTMKIVYFNNFPPVSWEDQDSRKMRGILIDVFNEALLTRMGIAVRHTGYPWKRAQQMVKDGEADGFATIPTPARRGYTTVSNEHVLTVKVTIFTKKGHPKIEEFKKIQKLSDLKQFSLLNYFGNGWAKKNLAGFNMNMSKNMDSVLKKLAAGRGELAVLNSQVTKFLIKKLGLENEVVEIPVVLDSKTFHLCVGNKSPHVSILKDFDNTIREMRKDGTLQAIYDKYLRL